MLVELVRSYEIKEYTYPSKVKRNLHVSEMEQNGWVESGQIKRMKPGTHILKATDEDYEWYAHFHREEQ